MSTFVPRDDFIIRDIPDFPNYQISENGEVYNKTTGKELKPYNGSIVLSNSGVPKKKSIKKLINEIFGSINLEEFEDIIGNKMYMIHKDGRIYSKCSRRFITDYVGKNGYVVVNLGKNMFCLHRLLALQFIKNDDKNKNIIDHINRIKTDNRIENLRFVTAVQNNTNKGLISNNTSGYTGVSYFCDKRKDPPYEYWCVNLKLGKKRITKCFPFIKQGRLDAHYFY